MSYGTKLAAYLSGATVAQLNSWASSGVLLPELGANPREYSFRDIVALRTMALLRAELSMQKIRAAIQMLEGQDFTDHLSTYRFASDGKSMKVWTDEGFLDLVDHPGQWEFVGLKDIYESFNNFRGRKVPHLLHPHDGIMVSPQRLGGVPTVSGTRVSFDLISDLTCGEDPMSAEEVADLYPSVDAQGVDAAIEFTKAVQGIAS